MFGPGIWRRKRFADSVPGIIYLQREINRLFPHVGQNTALDYPAINVWEKDNSLVVTTELPGVDEKTVSITSYNLHHKQSYPNAKSQYLQHPCWVLRLIWATQRF